MREFLMPAAPVNSEFFSEILQKNDYHLKLWISQAAFQIRIRSGEHLLRIASPEDIIHDIIDRVLAGKIIWEPDKIDINKFMYCQVRSFISNLARKEKRRNTGSFNRDIPNQSLEEMINNFDNDEYRKIILDELEKNNDRTGFIIFGKIISGAQTRHISGETGFTESEINNAKKRIRKLIKNLPGLT